MWMLRGKINLLPPSALHCVAGRKALLLFPPKPMCVSRREAGRSSAAIASSPVEPESSFDSNENRAPSSRLQPRGAGRKLERTSSRAARAIPGGSRADRAGSRSRLLSFTHYLRRLADAQRCLDAPRAGSLVGQSYDTLDIITTTAKTRNRSIVHALICDRATNAGLRR